MPDVDTEKKEVNRAIERARDGVSERIDELDHRLRKQLDFKTFATEHAPQLIAGGAVVGFLVGFGFPKPLRRLIQFGVPVALIAYKVKQNRDKASGNGHQTVI
ncbi:MAG TPA: hypothetical protein VJZ76_12575 [Thermoanaerobaculia bacterium]|nr:hypothetical protein [Thermoanaerobaculia bacterium]